MPDPLPDAPRTKAAARTTWVRRAAGVGGVIAAIAALLIGQGVGKMAGRSARQSVERALTSTEDIERQLDELASDPVSGPLWIALRDNFPEDYAEVRESLAETIKNEPSAEAVSTAAFKAMRAFIVSKSSALPSAPDTELTRMTASHLALIKILQVEDRQACADFGESGLKQGTVLSAAAQTKATAVGVATIEAARAGTVRPMMRPLELSEADAVKFVTAIEKFASPKQSALILEPDSVSDATIEERCSSVVALYSALASLPEKTSASVTAALFREATNAQSAP